MTYGTTLTGTGFVPYVNRNAGFSGIVPAGWIEQGPGEFGRGDPDAAPVFLVQLGVPGATVDLVTGLLLPKIGLEALPPRAGRLQNARLSWDLYTTERQDPDAGKMVVDIALAQSDAGAYVVLFGVMPDEHDAHHYAVFLRAVDALTPLSVSETETRPGGFRRAAGDIGAEVLLVKGERLENEASDVVAGILQTKLGLGTAFVELDALEIVDLEGVKLIYFPGGDCGSIRLSEKASTRVRRAVAAGTGYIGTCAGAFLATEATTTAPHVRLGGDSCSFGIFPGLAEWAGGEGTWPVFVDVRHPVFANSSATDGIHPVMHMRFVGGPSNLVPSYADELRHWRIATLDRPLDGELAGRRAAMTATVFGRGRVFLTGPHPEVQEATHPILVAAAEWCTAASDRVGQDPPVAVADIPAEGAADRFLVCSAAGSHDPHGYPVGFIWDFGDGSLKQYRPEAIHIYEKTGTYAITLTVTTGTRRSTRSTEVHIRAP